MNRAFKGVWIPKEIWTSKSLSLREKVFLVEIESLDNDDGCFASNEYFADFFDVSADRAGRVIASLFKKKFLTREIFYTEKNNKKRILRVSAKTPSGIGENTVEGIGENTVYNNTSNNNTDNNEKTNKKEMLKPLQDCVFNEISESFFNVSKENNVEMKFLEKNPKELEKKIKQGEEAIEKMIRIDGLTIDQIHAIIEEATTHDFWKKQIRSLAKLRQKNKDGIPYWAVMVGLIKERLEKKKNFIVDFTN
jgi:hypothetical protein